MACGCDFQIDKLCVVSRAASSRSNSTLALTVVVTVVFACCAVGMEKVVLLFSKDIRTTVADLIR